MQWWRYLVFVGAVFPLLAQQPQPDVQFEVASVKLSAATSTSWAFDHTSGILIARNITLKELFRQAYSLKTYQLVGGPDWIDSQQYDIDAKPETAAGLNEMRIMLRPLLAERFKLTFHVERRNVKVAALVVAKGGPKFKEVPHQNAASSTKPASFGENLQFLGRTIPEFVQMLNQNCGMLDFLPVIDLTGLIGAYDLRTETQANLDSPFKITILDQVCEAIGQLGLEFRRQEAPLDVYVIDSADRIPSEN